jgi:hypothetical protein
MIPPSAVLCPKFNSASYLHDTVIASIELRARPMNGTGTTSAIGLTRFNAETTAAALRSMKDVPSDLARFHGLLLVRRLSSPVHHMNAKTLVTSTTWVLASLTGIISKQHRIPFTGNLHFFNQSTIVPKTSVSELDGLSKPGVSTRTTALWFW